MMDYVVCLTLFPNLKVLVLAEILDLPCPNIFNAFLEELFVGLSNFYRCHCTMHGWCFRRSRCHDDAIKWKPFSALLPLYARNSRVTGEFPSQRPVTRSFDVFFDLRLNKRLSKQSRCWWCKTPSHLLWCHCNMMWGGPFEKLELEWKSPDVLSWHAATHGYFW